MTDNETNQGEQSATNTGEGNQLTQAQLNEQTNIAAQRLEDANAEAERINLETKARIALGGSSEAGSVPKPDKEISPEDYVKGVMAGEIGENN